MVQRYEGRVAVVAGAATAIGAATCRRLAAEGATVVAVDMDVAAGEAIAAEVRGLFVPADMTNEADAEHVHAWVYSRRGRVDLAVHPATAVRLGCAAVLPYLLEQGRGAVVNVVPPAGAGRDEVLATTRELGVRFAPDLRVTAVAPGPAVPPGQVAAAIAFLGSDDAAFVTAATLPVDGGATVAATVPL